MKVLRFFLILGFAAALWQCGKKDPAPAPQPVQVPTFDTSTPSTVSDLTTTSAKVSSLLLGNGGAAISQHGHVYSKTNPTPALPGDSKTERGSTGEQYPLQFSSELKNLEPGVTYSVRPYATNSAGTSYGAVFQVKTGTVTVLSPTFSSGYTFTEKTDNSVKVSTTINDNPGKPITQHGFVWAEAPQTPTLANNKFELGATNGPFPYKLTATIQGLKANTLYRVSAFTTTSEGVFYDKYTEVTTNPPPSTVDVFSRKADFPETLSFNYRLLNAGGKVYVLGGQITPGSSVLNPKVWEYDPAKNTWTAKAPIPNSGVGGSDMDGETILFSRGGKLYKSNKNEFLFEYDPGTNLWTKKTTVGVPFLGLITQLAFVVNERVFLYEYTTNKFFEYDVEKNKVTQKATPTVPKGTSSDDRFCSTTTRGYLFSGNKLYEYAPDSDAWVEKAIPVPGSFKKLISSGDEALYAYGSDNSNPLNGILYLFDSRANSWRTISVKAFEFVNTQVTTVFPKTYFLNPDAKANQQWAAITMVK